MRNPLLRFGLLFFLALSLAGQTSDWKAYKNVPGNFSMMFPVEPQDSVNKTGDESIESHNLMAQTSSGVYLVTYAAMTNLQPVNDATYQVYKNAVLKELPTCAVDSEQAANPAIQGYIGHLYKMTCNISGAKVSAEGNLYWGKHYAYAVMVMYQAAVARPEGAKKFLESFSVIDLQK
jgi:hypothetical protein